MSVVSSEGYSRSETTALRELASLLGKSDFVLEYASALLLASLAGRRVAVVGIVKRGKSTLINALIGAEVTPVGMLPETAAVLAFGTSGIGRIAAHGFDEGLRRRSLPGSARGFRRSVRRDGRRKIVAGVLDCKSPIPSGLWLIDTPGSLESEVGERSVGVSGVPKSLGQLIDALVVVVGIPGFSSSDLKLTREIQRLHIGVPTYVVVKALDSSVSMSDLVEYSKLYLRDLSATTFLQTDDDQSALGVLVDRLASLPNPRHGQDAARTTEGVRQSLIGDLETCMAEQLRNGLITVPRRIRRKLPVQFRTTLKANSPRSLRRKEKTLRKASESKARLDYRADLKKWKAQERVLKSVVYNAEQELKNSKIALKSNVKILGCSYWVTFALSFILFPVGPVVWAIYGFFRQNDLSEKSKARAPSLESRVNQSENVLRDAIARLENHKTRRP